VLLLLLFNQASVAANFVQLDEQKLAETKAVIQKQSAATTTLAAYQDLLKKAAIHLETENYSVTDKAILAPTDNPHDYLSISRYWWPDASKADGLPWIRRDGETNPDTQTNKVDRKRIGNMTTAVKELSYAYYFSGDEKYAKKGVNMIKTWFLDPQTRMNPHLEYAQSVPGIDKRRRSGILDGRLIPLYVLDAIEIFSKSSYWNDENQAQMNEWLDAYLTWLTTSKLGKSGAKQSNNHGSWYRFQVTALAWYLGKSNLLETQLQIAKIAMAEQLDKHGAQTHELKRTKSYFYSCFNLNALTRTAIVAEKAGDSMWDYPSKDSSKLAQAIEYLIPAANGEQEWPHPTKGLNFTQLIAPLERYISHSNKNQYRGLLSSLVKQVREKANGENYEARLLNDYALLKPSVLD